MLEYAILYTEMSLGLRQTETKAITIKPKNHEEVPCHFLRDSEVGIASLLATGAFLRTVPKGERGH